VEAGLYIVATPIGNLSDMVPRAVMILQAVDLIAAEDTRHSRVLLQHFGITTEMMAYHEHNAERGLGRIAAVIEGGGSVALISDAGTPLVSDPGYSLVREAHRRDWRTVPVPGACAAIAALSVAGLPTDRFLFEGFLPSKAAARERRLSELRREHVTWVVYEAPHRLLETLLDMRRILGGQRELTLCRELTKTFETVRHGTMATLCDWVTADANQQRGEIVLVVQGDQAVSAWDADAERLLGLAAAALPARQASRLVAQYTGLPAREVYQRLLGAGEA
jgi:16S rRNA (cytidine1402-2'-O)-methyltransferase